MEGRDGNKELSRQTVGLLRSKNIRKQYVGTLHSQQVAGKRRDDRGSNSDAVDGTMIQQALKAGKAGDWSKLLKSDKLIAWMAP